MLRPVRYFGLLSLTALLATIFALSCSLDSSGPAMQTGYLALAPAFESGAAAIVPIDRVHVILIRVADEAVALDDTIAVDPASQTVDLTLSVAVHGAEEAFYLAIECLDPAGEVVFRGGPIEVTATTARDSEPAIVEVALTYVGLGFDAAAIEMLTSLVYIEFGETITLEAQALDSSGAVIEGTPIKWISEDPNRVSVPDPAVGRIVGGSERGWVHVEAQLLTGQSSLADVFVEPVPSVIAVVSGDGQTGSVDTELSQPLVVEVRAVDGPMADVSVEFTTPDGGSFGQAAVITDGEGLASTTWTLGPTEGTQSATATVIDVSGIQVAFTATAVVPGEPRLSFTVQPSDAEQGQVITPGLEVTALDDLGGVDVDFVGDVTVALASNPGDGTLAGTTTVAAASGVALFDDLSIDLPGVGYTLQATALGYTSATSAAFNITATPAQGGIRWTGAGGDGNWSNANNWDPGRVPAPADTVFITLQDGSTVTLDVDATVAFLFLEVPLAIATGQSLAIDSLATIGAPGDLQLGNGATLAGPGNVVIEGTLTWGGGTIAGTGLLSVSSTGILNINAANQVVLDGRTIQNDGDVLWLGGDIVMDNGARITNNGTMDMHSDFVIGWGGAGTEPRIENNGSLIQSDMVTTIYVPVDNGGTIDVTRGSLDLRGATTHTSAVITVGAATGSATISFQDVAHVLDAGTAVQIGTNGRVRFPSGTAAVAGPYDQTGTGSSTDISGGTVTFDGGNQVTIRRLDLSSGSLGGTGTISVTDSMIWRGGIVQGAGVTRIANMGVMWMLGGSKTFDQRTIENVGKIVWESGNVTATNGAQLNNLAGATFEMRAGDTFGGTGSLHNAGTFLYSNTGVGFFGLALDNIGTLDLDVQAGGILALTGQFTHESTGIIQGNGTLDLTTSNVLAFDGQVNPGTSAGVLNFVGDAFMSAQTTANIELGGVNAGTDHDQVNINGAISLAGTVNLSIINGFTPTVGNKFTVLTFASRSGDFANITGMDIGSGLRFDTVWTATSLDLEVIQPPPAQILFAGDSAGGLATGVFTVNPDGTGLTHPYSTASLVYEEVYPRWSPNRERIVFTNRTGFVVPNPNQLYMMHALGDTLVTLVSDTSTFIPRWSPNGAHLAFECGNGWDMIDICVIGNVTGPLASLNGVGNGAGKIYLTDFDIVNWGGGSWVFAWDPLNPDRIAVVRDSLPPVGGQGQSMIFTMLYDGSARQRLLPTGVLDAGNGPLLINGGMDWSPDGQWLVFAAIDPQGQMNIYKIDRNGGNLTQLTATPDQDSQPLWSPNGAEILFGRNLETGGFCDYDGWIMNSDGGSAHQITAEHVCDWNLENLAGDWSPDGQQIVLTGFDAPYGNLSIYVVPRTVTAATYFAQRMLISRTGAIVGTSEVTDIQPTWRP